MSAVSPVAALHQATVSQVIEKSLPKSYFSDAVKHKLASHALTVARQVAFTVQAHARIGAANPFVRQAVVANTLAPATTSDAFTSVNVGSVNPGDANGDYVVSFADFTILSNHFGTATAGGASAGDFDLNGVVNFADYTLLSNNFGNVYTQPTPPPTNPVTITPKTMTGFTQLGITGSAANDTVLVTQSGGTLTIVANGQTTNYAANYGNLVIHGGAGNDSITIDPSVNIVTLLYGDAGSDTLVNRTTARATIVDIDSSTNTVTGNGTNTSYWVNPNDVVNASALEIANTGVNRVASFYQPSIGSVPRDLLGQNLVDPTDGGATHRLTNNSFWGTGAVANDVNQGSIGDCYFLASIASLANNTTTRFMNTGVDLGDGTYAVRFVRNGVTSFVRVDGDISNNYYTQVGASGNMWAPIYEKAYAFYRTGASTYASLNSGNPTYALNDLGFRNSSISAKTSSATTLLNAINNAINSGNPVTAYTQGVAGGAPVIGYHAYSVFGAYVDGSGTVMIQLRNPWGFDGAGSDSNPNDALQTLSYSAFSQNYYALCYGTV
jgi:hypothetical protein